MQMHRSCAMENNSHAAFVLHVYNSANYCPACFEYVQGRILKPGLIERHLQPITLLPSIDMQVLPSQWDKLVNIIMSASALKRYDWWNSNMSSLTVQYLKSILKDTEL